MLTNPHNWYPQARALSPRHVIAHVGPTNSGKTHGALQALMKAPTGTYCGPLRLLAQEQFERCAGGDTGKVRMSLRTGEMVSSWRHGISEPPVAPIATVQPATGQPGQPGQPQSTGDWRADGATHLSCTVEMADLNVATNVAVLDEVQLMADEERGWAFTQCLLGVPAREVYVCGEEAILPVLRVVCGLMGSELTVRRFERLSPLRELEDPVTVDQLEPGDAIIAFSRNDIFQLKRTIEHRLHKPNSCAVVYGALPLAHRLRQAASFNSGQVPFLIASDAIGLGLNLNIRRILFTGLRKYTREADCFVPVDSRQLRQIGGRAGRFASGFEGGGAVGVLQLHEGVVGHKRGCELGMELKRAWHQPVKEYTRAGIIPPDHILLQAAGHDACKLEEAMLRSQATTLSAPYFYCHVTPQISTLNVIKPYLPKLDAQTALLLAKAPVRHPRPASLLVIESMTAHLASCRPPADYLLPKLSCHYQSKVKSRSREERLGEAEECHRALELYKWVSLRFPHAFTAWNACERFKREQQCADVFIEEHLKC